MRRRQPVLIVVAGIVCAFVAVVAVRRALTSQRGRSPARDGVNVLLAKRDIAYGEVLVLEGDASQVNVGFFKEWPKSFVPEGAVTSAEAITTRPMKADAAFPKHDVILRSQIVPEDEFVPADMSIERLTVDLEDVRGGRLLAGTLVDVLRVHNNVPAPFMRNVRLYAIGSLDVQGRPVKSKEPPPNVYLMIKKDDSLTFLKARYSGDRFVLVQAADPSTGGPQLVDGGTALEAKTREGQALVERGKNLMKEEQYDQAGEAFLQVVRDYAECPEVALEATRLGAECRQRKAESYCGSASAALAAKDFTTALRWLDKVESEFADLGVVLQQAQQLRRATEEALERYRVETRYQALLADLATSLERGAFPQTRELLTELKAMGDSGFAPSGGLPAIATVYEDYDGRLKGAQAKYEIDKKVFETHVKQGNMDQARAKLTEMQNAYPAHPELPALQQQLAAGAGGNEQRTGS